MTNKQDWAAKLAELSIDALLPISYLRQADNRERQIARVATMIRQSEEVRTLVEAARNLFQEYQPLVEIREGYKEWAEGELRAALAPFEEV